MAAEVADGCGASECGDGSSVVAAVAAVACERGGGHGVGSHERCPAGGRKRPACTAHGGTIRSRVMSTRQRWRRASRCMGSTPAT